MALAPPLEYKYIALAPPWNTEEGANSGPRQGDIYSPGFTLGIYIALASPWNTEEVIQGPDRGIYTALTPPWGYI